jgi:hypothetical protein
MNNTQLIGLSLASILYQLPGTRERNKEQEKGKERDYLFIISEK